ncbi:hypothetical protein HY636_01635 [Candidatus Woesearchaeota archaeon]|nr:hypothetical protein [Candidatus Woesearchaeota archaeon]
MKLEEMMSEANRIFGVSQDVLSAKVSEHVVLAVLDKIDSASKKIRDVRVTQEFAVADIELEVVADYNFVVLKYSNLVDFAGSLGKNAEEYAKGKVKERLELAKERLKEVETLYNSYEVSDKDIVKKDAMDVALNSVKGYISFLNTRLKIIDRDEVQEKGKSTGRVEQKAMPAHVQSSRSDIGNTGGKTKKGKEILCFKIGSEQYYRISELAEMFGTTESALRQYQYTKVENKEMLKLEKEGTKKFVVYNGKRNHVYSFDAFETILPKKYHPNIKDALVGFTPNPASKEDYNVVGEERSIGRVVERGNERREVAERPAAIQADESDNVVRYFAFRGKEYYSGPEAAKLLGVDYNKFKLNIVSNLRFIEMEAEGKLKVFKRERRGQAVKAFRSDALLELVPEKYRGSGLEKRLRTVKTEQYEEKVKVLTLADIGISADEYRPPVREEQKEDTGYNGKKKGRIYERHQEGSDEEAQELERRAERIAKDVVSKVNTKLRREQGRETKGEERKVKANQPISRRTVSPANAEKAQEFSDDLKQILNPEGLEQTIEGAETIYFVGINGQRYFSASALKTMFEKREYDGTIIPDCTYSANIINKKDKFPEGTDLKFGADYPTSKKKCLRENHLVREDYVNLMLPNYATDKFGDLLREYSLKAYPLSCIDAESFEAEIKAHRLYNNGGNEKKGKRKVRVDDNEQVVNSDVTDGKDCADSTPLEERLYRPDSGREKVNGQTTPQINLDKLPEQIAYDELPNYLGQSMGIVDVACQQLVSEGKLEIIRIDVEALGDAAPKVISREQFPVIKKYLDRTTALQ